MIGNIIQKTAFSSYIRDNYFFEYSIALPVFTFENPALTNREGGAFCEKLFICFSNYLICHYLRCFFVVGYFVVESTSAGGKSS